MRRLFLAALTALLIAALAGPAMAHPTRALAPTLPTDVTYSATDNVEYLGRFPEHTGTAGGMRLGDRYYLTDPRGVYVYDVTDAAAPALLGSAQLFQTETGAALAQEDPNTNGEILVVDGAPTPYGTAQLTVLDVSDPANGVPVLGTADVTDHTWTCVSDEVDGVTNTCAFVYGRTGHIVDLRDPSTPTLLPYTWRQVVGYGSQENEPYAHDLTEIRPGLVMSAGKSNVLMDTADPTVPVRLNTIEGTHPFSGLGYHSVEWALEDDGTLSDTLVAGTEIAPAVGAQVLNGASVGSDCQGEESVVETFDASAVAAAVEAYVAGDLTAEDVRGTEFALVDAFDVSGRGIYLDGGAPANVLYCAHWMEFHPAADSDGGRLAVSYYDRGTRFLSVAADGTMSEDGWIVPFQGYSGSVQWVEAEDGAEVLYIHDYTRGLEVVRLSHDAATGKQTNDDSPMALTSNYTPARDVHTDSVAPAMALLMGLGMAVLDVRRRRARARA